MAKQLNVNLSMTADTSKAKTSLQDLQKQLDQLMLTAQKSSHGQLGISQDIQKATALAAQLKVQLESATSSTGNLDLTKFYSSLQKSKTSIMDYKNALVSLGPSGTQAFANLASSIMRAEIPFKRTNARLQEFMTTLKNTARWQISSSILHGFMGALQGAYGYAQDLNESLNNIRIVTGQSVDQMAQFADQANRAAKELSTTTTAYTDAALIYYQQGLDDKEVKDRTDVTIKLANVSRQSAEEVSSQMTAIWNNFADGSKSLEYYADVITKLGASTASSSAEISDGIQKFAAVADTVGLSYEKATAALATVVAETRQSADVVGTAFKTLFARVQGLNLGETLEDGVTLNKYSAALKTVGVDILTANGELKNMDSILDELGEKWKSIGEEQQVALAETVAGTRQYAQFMAIMENYDKILANQQLAAGSEGTLQEQQDIYAEGWEAASKRVKAAAQDIYNDLLDDKFFITLLNGFEKVLSAIDNFIEGIGGLKTLLPLIGSIVTQVFGNQISNSIRNAMDNLRMFTAAGREAVQNVRNETQKALLQTATQNMPGGEGAGMTASLQAQYQIQEALKQKATELTEEEIKQAQVLLDVTAAVGQEAIEAGKAYDEQVKITKELEKQQQKQAYAGGGFNGLKAVRDAQQELEKNYKSLDQAQEIFFNKLSNQTIDKNNIQNFTTDINTMIGSLKNAGLENDKFNTSLTYLSMYLKQGQFDKAAILFNQLSDEIEFLSPSFEKYKNILIEVCGIQDPQATAAAKKLAKSFEDERKAALDAAEANKNVEKTGSQLAEQVRQMSSSTDLFATSLTRISSLLMSVTSAINALKNIGNIWSNEDLTSGEKFLQTMSALTMVIPLVTTLVRADNIVWLKSIATRIAETTATSTNTVAKRANALASKAAAAANTGFLATLIPLLPFIIAIGAALLVLVGIIYAIAKAVKKANENSLAGQLKKSKEEGEKLQENLEKINDEIDELHSKIDTFTDLQEKIKGCAKGSQEWYDTLYSINSTISELLSSYPELAQYIRYDENGVPYIAQEGLDVVESGEQEKRQQAIVDKAVNAAKTDVLEAKTAEEQLQNILNTAVTGFGTGGTLNPFLAMEQADFVSDFLSAHLQELQTFDQQELLKLVNQYHTEHPDLGLTEAEKASMVQSLWDIQPQIQQYANEMRLQKNAGAAQITTAFGITNKSDLFNASMDSDFRAALKEAGLEFQDIRNLFTDIAAAQEEEKTSNLVSFDATAFADLKKIVDDVLSGGSVSAKDWEKLDEEYKQYFVDMADGSHKLAMDAQEFYDLVMGKEREKILQNILQDKENVDIEGINRDVSAFFGTADSLEELKQLQQQLKENGLEFAGTFAEYAEVFSLAAIKAATSLEELDVAVVEAQRNGVDVNYASYAEGLTKVAEQYDNTTFELGRYSEALEEAKRNGDEASQTALKEAEANLRAATAAGELAKKYSLTATDIERYADQLKLSGEYEDASRRQLVEMAKDQLRYDRAVISAQKNMTKWNKDLEVFQTTGQLVSDTAEEMAEAYGDLLDIDGTELSAAFLTNADNLKLLQEALDGSAEAYDKLQELVRQDIAVRVGFDDTEFQDKFANLLNSYYQVQGLDDLEIGAQLNDEGFLNALSEMVNAAGMTAQEATDYLSSMGVDAEVVNEPETITERVGYDLIPEVTSEPVAYLPPGGLAYATYPKVTYTAKPVEVEKTVAGTALKVTAASKSSGGTVKHSGSTPAHGGSNTGKSSGGGGGGGKSNKQASKQHKDPTDEKERYHLLNEQLDDLSREYDKAGKAKDRLFGANRLRAINEEIKALDKLIAHNQSYLKAIEAYRKKDRAALVNGGLSKEWVDSNGDLKTFVSKGIGNVSFDKYGNVENYDAIIEHAVAEYNAAVDAYNQVAHAEGVAEEDVKLAEDIFKQAEMQYKLTMEALQQYEETNNKFQEKVEEIRDSVREQQDKRFEEWSYKLELKIKINDEDKRYLEYFRKHLEHFAKDAFAPVTELLSIWNSTGAKSDWTVLQQGASDLKSATEELLSASHGDPIIDENTGAVLEDFMYSQADWMSGLDDCEDKIYAQIDALYELDETMTDYYANTLSEAEAQLDKYMGKIEDCTAVLKHYQSVLELLSKEVNYEWMGEILTAQRDTVKQEMLAARTEAEYAAKQYETMLARYEATKNQVDEGTRQKMEDELQAQYESMTKWQDAMLTKTEEFAQACIAVYENMIKEQSDLMEKALTNGQGFDSMLSSLERVSSYQDMMLTKTNQIYGTNKLMRQLSQDIDKTDSSAHKTKLANFRQEIEDMQNMNEMSKFDLDVANARYEVLKAQIALEDAQNAKSIVRLQRDNEGNYGYVYTADRDKMNNAQQELEDKQNDLYNLTLNKANEAAEALIKLDQEFVQTMEEIALQYQGNEAKIQEEQQRALEEYLKIRSQWIADATTADYWQHVVSVTQTNEAYKVAYQENLTDMETWHDQGMEYIKSTQAAHTELTDNMKEYVAPVIGESLDELREKTNALRQDSEKYQQWFDNFAATNASRLDQIAAITHEYYLQRQEVEALISSLEELVQRINEARAAEAAGNGSSGNSGNEPADWSLEMYRSFGTDAYADKYAGRNNKISTTGMSASQYIYDTDTIDKIISEIHNAGMESWFENTMGSSFANIKAAARAGNDPFVELLKKKITGLFSGGYTGSWGDTGKLAFLHEKELVLNAQDTNNILAAVNLVRELNSAIDLRAASSSLGALLRSPGLSGTGSMLEQNVTISAEFPNAVNHYEIEEAFNTLINRASQYAYRG